MFLINKEEECMKRRKHGFALVTSLLLSMLANTATAQAKLEPGNYQVDPMHSKVGFEISHLVISSVEGKFKIFEGTMDIAKDFSNSRLIAKVNVDSIDTGTEKRDQHLKSPEFFNTGKYPEMIFESSVFSGQPESFKMDGNLTIHGVKKRVIFSGKYLGTVLDAYGQKKAVFNASTKINRKDFGLSWNTMVDAGPVIGDEVSIDLKIQAVQQKIKK
jgi:polyisoprenoid-binding protein YceI